MLSVTVGLQIPERRQCFRPPTIAHGEASLYQDENGVVAIYTCHTGYFFAAGGSVRTTLCRDNAWSQEIPDCERT